MTMTRSAFSLRRHRLTAIGLTCLTLLGGAASAQTSKGSSAACEQWAILSTAGQSSGRVEVCSRLMQEMPRLREQIAYLNQRAGSDADVRRDLQRFAETLNQMARQLKAQDVQRMADTLVARLEQSRRAGDGALMDELDRLRLGMRDVQRTLQDMRTDEANRRKVDVALSGDAGASIAKFDFDAAKSILGSLGRIEAMVSDVDRKVTEMNDPAEARVLIASDRRRATQQMERFVQAGAERRCSTVYRELVPVLQASEIAEKEARFTTARRLLMSVWTQAAQATAELQRADMMKAQAATMRASEENELERRIVESRRQLEGQERQVKNYEQSLADSRQYQQNAIQQEETNFRSEMTSRERIVSEAAERLSRARTELRDAEALAQTTDDQKQRRKAAVEQARRNLEYPQQQLGEAEARVAELRRDFERNKRSENWPTAPNSMWVKQIADNVEWVRRSKAARDLTVAALASAAVEGKQDPGKAAEDLHAVEAEGHDIMNGQIPMPRRRSTRNVMPVVPNSLCV